MQELDDPIPLSALQHAVYCLRQAALIHIERLWEENLFTAEGRVLHEVVHEPADRKRGKIRRVTALPIASPDTRSSTRRFCWRPAELSLVATGKVLPKPFALTEFVATPSCTR